METIICLRWSNNKLGCAYYTSQSLELYLMEDIYDSNEHEHISLLMTQISPTLVLIPESNLDILQDLIKHQDDGSYKTQAVANKDVSFERGRLMLLNWYIRHIQLDQDVDQASLEYQNIYLRDPEEGSKTHAYLQLEGLIQLEDSTLSVGCIGAILQYLQNVQSNHHSENAPSEEDHRLSIQPISIQVFSCQDYIHITSDTLRALCIFDLETNANMKQPGEKEIVSLFGLLDKTRSVLGKQMLKQWVAHPLQDKKTLDHRHKAIRFFVNQVSREQLIELGSYLKHIKNIHRLLSKIKQSRASHSDWQYILKFAYYSIKIINMIQYIIRDNEKVIAELPVIQRFKELTSTSMQEVGAHINTIIDFESSKEEARIVVKEGVDKELDALREKYNGLDDYLLQVSKEISKSLPISLGAALNVVYFPQLGYLITLPQYHLQNHCPTDTGKSMEDNSSIDTEQHQQYLVGFELQFTTADNLYYKNDKTKELDKNLGDIHAIITDKEIEILEALSVKILHYSTDFIRIVKSLSELDCILSLALVALKFDYTEPTMTTDTTLKIIQGRHPLQELCVDIFVPNDTHLEGGKGFPSHQDGRLSSVYRSSQVHGSSTHSTRKPSDSVNSVQIVTGANFSGKSVYLKQIALIVYMAHIGSFVPAEKAVIGIIDKLFARIQTSETVSKPQSAFGYDIQQLNRALHGATQRSLVIIDEFGRGTDCSDGAALFCAVIGHFLSKDSQCPKIVASTHFHDLITQSILSSDDGISLSQTEVLSHPIKETSSESGDEVVFLYRIKPGNGYHSSYGTWCASIAGLPSHTIQRAVELSDMFSKGKPINRQNHEHDTIFQKLQVLRQDFLETDINDLNPLKLIQSVQRLYKS